MPPLVFTMFLKIINSIKIMALYLSLLPTDLLQLLLLYFSSRELLAILPQLKDIKKIDRLIHSNVFWLKIWRRDISTFGLLPNNPYEKYREIFSELVRLTNKNPKITYLAENGYDILLSPLLSNLDDYNFAMRNAAEGGHTELVKSLLDKGAYNYDQAMARAAYGGHIDIVELMLQKGATSYNLAMSAAAFGGHMDIINLMLKLGANDYNRTMDNAAFRGHMEIVKLMLDRGANNYNQTMADAALGGYTDIVRLMLERGANYYKLTMYYAAERGYADIVKLLLENSVDDYKWILGITQNKEIKDLINAYQNRNK